MPVSPTYASYLVRLWRRGDSEPQARATDWQGEVKHIQSGRRLTFSTLDELLSFLRRSTGAAGVLGRLADE